MAKQNFWNLKTKKFELVNVPKNKKKLLSKTPRKKVAKTTEQYFQEFYNEIRRQIEQGTKANFTCANQIWAEYKAALQKE